MPVGHAVVGEPREVGHRVVGARRGGDAAAGVGGADPVADEAAVGLDGARDHGGPGGVAGEGVGAGAVVGHRDGGPAGAVGVGGVGQADVRAGIDDLVFERHGGEPVGVGGLDGDGDGLAGGGLQRGMADLAHGGRGLCGEHRVERTRRGAGLCALAGFQRDVEVAVAAGQALVEQLDGDRVGAAEQVAGGIRQGEGDRGVVLAVLDRGGLVAQLGAADVVGEDVHPVDPHVEPVVVADPGEELRDLAGVRHLEGAAQVDGRVAVLHVGQGGGDAGFPVAGGEGGRGPRRVAETGRPPASVRLGAALEEPPAARAGGQQGARVDARAGGRAPVSAEVVVERRIEQFHRVARGVANGRPWEADLVAHLVGHGAGGVAQGHGFALVRELAGPRAEDAGDAEPGGDRGRVAGDHQVAAGRQGGAGREGVLHPIGELPAGEVHRLGAGVVQLDELDERGLRIRVDVQLVDHHRGGQPPGQAGEHRSEDRGSAPAPTREPDGRQAKASWQGVQTAWVHAGRTAEPGDQTPFQGWRRGRIPGPAPACGTPGSGRAAATPAPPARAPPAAKGSTSPAGGAMELPATVPWCNWQHTRF